jgi:Mg/Co/Ni transporter MgtE
VQSSAIIVQGLANNTLSGSLFNRLVKEVSLSLLNGLILATILFFRKSFLLNVNYYWCYCYCSIDVSILLLHFRGLCTVIAR